MSDLLRQMSCLRRGVLFGAALFLLVANSAAAPSDLAPEVGYDHGLIESARGLALGGGLLALSNSTDAVGVNPAGLATTRVYHAAGIASIWPQARRQSYGGSIVDSVVNRSGIAGGFTGLWTRQDRDGIQRQSLDLRFALAAPISDRVFVGAAGRYLALTQDGFPANGIPPSLASAGLDGEEIVADITFDAGITVKPTPELAVAVVGYNLTDPGHSFLPLIIGGGVGYGALGFSVGFDALADFSTYEESVWRLGGGAEFLLADTFPLRAGYLFDEGTDRHAVSAGVGYVSPAFSVDASARFGVSGPSAATILIQLRYHVDAAAGLTR